MFVIERPGRGKGSHRLYALVDSGGSEVARFGQRDAIRTELIKAGMASKLSQAAIADVLRVSQQRVGQLANAS